MEHQNVNYDATTREQLSSVINIFRVVGVKAETVYREMVFLFAF